MIESKGRRGPLLARWSLRVLLAGTMAWAGLGPEPVRAQQDGVLQLGDPVHGFLERQQAAGRLPDAFLSHQPLSAYEARVYLDTLAAHPAGLTRVDRQLLARYRGEAPGSGAAWANRRAGALYRNGRDLFSFEDEGYRVQVNPLLHAGYGPVKRSDDGHGRAWQYSRGFQVAGHIGRYLFFDTRLTEDASRLPWHQGARGTAPRLGQASRYGDGDELGYFTATGIVGLRTRHVEVRFGRDRYRWGHATGSVLLSNYASPYEHLQVRTTLGRFQYTNLFAGFSEIAFREKDVAVPRKYGVFHRLAVQLPGRVELAVFETVMFATDTLGARQGFDLSYLNPVIFYRAVERERGSPDNVMMGASLAWTAFSGLRLYGDFILDELIVDRIGDGWWGNKWGWVAGFQAVDLPVPNLSVRAEMARLRPFLYAHRTPGTTYLHYDDLLGHPAGPNTSDLAVFIDYRPLPRLTAALDVAQTQRGRNPDGQNIGADPRISYRSRSAEDGISLLDGVRQTQLLVEARAGYELLPDLYLEAALRYESLDDAETGLERYVHPFLQVRWNYPFLSTRY